MLRYRTNVVSENPVLMPYTGNKTATLTKDLRMGEKNPNQSCTPVFKTYFLSEQSRPTLTSTLYKQPNSWKCKNKLSTN